MNRPGVLLLLIALGLSGALPLAAQSKNTYSQPKSVTKIDKKHAKAQRKYAKQQKKAEKKMVKTSKKNTHIPPQQF
jgi:membrane protein insertase Oxa1/YidC/SpoIIIJ